ncbi:MAG: TlpA disulfide reductase family protein, partial [Planctomycetota bacterium]
VPCKKASPFVQELHEDYKDKGLVVLAPAFRSPDEEITKYFDDHKYTYTPLPNAERLVQEYRIRAFPTFVLIGPRGQELERFVGGKPENTFPTIRKMLDRFMEEQG